MEYENKRHNFQKCLKYIQVTKMSLFILPSSAGAGRLSVNAQF